MIFELGVGAVCALGLYFMLSAAVHPRVRLWLDIARYVSVLENSAPTLTRRMIERLKKFVQERPKSLPGADREVVAWMAQAGKSGSVTEFRKEQLSYSALSAAAIAGWLSLRSFAHRPLGAASGISLLIGASLLGIWLAKWQLMNLATKRRNLAEAALPTVLELLAFAVAAGEPMLSLLHRVTHTCSGPLVDELRIALRDITMGITLVESFSALGERIGSPQIQRSLKAIVIAIERGTPLAEILRAQAADARASRLRELLVLAGKKETAMMIPVVFFVLPMIVAVALYPGFIALQGM